MANKNCWVKFNCTNLPTMKLCIKYHNVVITHELQSFPCTKQSFSLRTAYVPISSPSAQVSFLGSREDSDTCGIQDMSQWNLQHYIFDKKFNTPSVPNDLSVLIGTQILRNLWGICENAQLGIWVWTNFPMSYYTLKTELSIKKCDGLIRL
jgi:hypothetical protein